MGSKKITFEQAVKSLWEECEEWGSEVHPFVLLMSFAYRSPESVKSWEDADHEAKKREKLGLALSHLGERLLGENV